MTTTFDDRERNYENKFAHDQELEFKISARMANLLGVWAAGEMKLEGNPADSYADSIVELTVNKNFKELATKKIQEDLKKSGVEIGSTEIEQEIEKLLLVAKDQIIIKI